jgi:hypothetical protein
VPGRHRTEPGPGLAVCHPKLELVEGEAGVGKSTLLSAAVDAAAAMGWRVHRTRPTQAEARFAYAGLADLLDGPPPAAAAPPDAGLGLARAA